MKYNDYFKAIPVFETDRLVLRPFGHGDMDEYMAFAYTPEVRRYLGGGLLELCTEQHVANWLNKINRRALVTKSAFTWCVEYKPMGKAVGRVDLGGINKRSAAELSYYSASAYWNRGLAKEALGEVLRFGVEDLELHRIQALIMPENIYAVKALKRLGFEEEGCLRKYPFGKGFHDALMLAFVEERNMKVKQAGAARDRSR